MSESETNSEIEPIQVCVGDVYLRSKESYVEDVGKRSLIVGLANNAVQSCILEELEDGSEATVGLAGSENRKMIDKIVEHWEIDKVLDVLAKGLRNWGASEKTVNSVLENTRRQAEKGSITLTSR